MKNAKKCGNAQKILKSIVYSYGIEYKSKICEMRGCLKQKSRKKHDICCNAQMTALY